VTGTFNKQPFKGEVAITLCRASLLTGTRKGRDASTQGSIALSVASARESDRVARASHR